jgi:hypothetical protein
VVFESDVKREQVDAARGEELTQWFTRKRARVLRFHFQTVYRNNHDVSLMVLLR